MAVSDPIADFLTSVRNAIRARHRKVDIKASRFKTELAKGDQNDPFVLGLMAQAYEKLGDRPRAGEYFRKVMASPSHNINSAFARPLARAFLR